MRLAPRLDLGYFPYEQRFHFEQSFLWFQDPRQSRLQTARGAAVRPAPLQVQVQPVAGRDALEWSCMYAIDVSMACSHPRWPYPASFPPPHQ